MRGRAIRLSVQRRMIIDLLYFATGIPTVPVHAWSRCWRHGPHATNGRAGLRYSPRLMRWSPKSIRSSDEFMSSYPGRS